MENLQKKLLTLGEISKDDIMRIFQKTAELKKQRCCNLLSGRIVALYFGSPSLRTRISFEVAIRQLGGHSIFIKAIPTEIYPSEAVHDQAMVLNNYVDGIIIRIDNHTFIEEFAKYADIPVINGMSKDFHPCQTLADLFTIFEEKKQLEKLKLVYLGDGGGNTAHSMLFGCAKLGINLIICCPKEFKPNKNYLSLAEKFARDSGSEIIIEHNPQKATKDADVIYTDAWEADQDEIRYFWPYRVTRNIMRLAKNDVIVLHCLPAIRGLEIEPEILDGPLSRVKELSQNRLHVSKGILSFFLGEK